MLQTARLLKLCPKDFLGYPICTNRALCRAKGDRPYHMIMGKKLNIHGICDGVHTSKYAVLCVLDTVDNILVKEIKCI